MIQKMNLNDLSRVLFIKYGSHTILCPGDLEERGWTKLLEQPDFINELKKTTVLIASHHGRDSGFCGDIFKYFTPKIILVSDGRFGDTSATDRYGAVLDEKMTINKSNTKTEDRKVLTTRKDGSICASVVNGKDLYINSSA